MPDTPETDLTLSFAPSPRRVAEEASPLEAGKVFGSYRLLRKLGEGGFAEVWEAEELESGRRLASKVLTGVRVASPESLERFQREGRLAASLNHPRCVYVFGAGEIAGHPAILMELVPGGTLQDRLDREGPLEPRRAVDLILDLLDGLEAAHRAGILHRDVKPSNCFVDEEGRAKIGDFGLSRTLETDVNLTQTGTFLGTPSYASPEQVRGRDVDVRSDLYSVGATLYALLAGKPPFTAAGAGEVLARILSEAPEPLRGKVAKISWGLERLVLRLLSKDPQKRFPDYASLREALLPFSSAGMTAAGVARRFAAYLLDQVIRLPVDFFVTFPLWTLGLGSPVAVRYILISVAFDFLYFTVTEKVWGRSPGKALCGLYVTNRAGERMTWGQAAARTLFYLIPSGSVPFLPLALVLGERLNHPPYSAIVPYVPWLGLLVIVSTMRLRNGFAGPHELATGTRVRVARRKERPAAPLDLVTPGLPFTLPPPDFGPFRTSEIVWEEVDEALLVGRDPLLGRPVWIHRFQDVERGRPIQELARSRPARLRWLQGRRAEGMSWDAYEAPTGGTLEDWVHARGRLSWGEVRGVLFGLARVLEDGLREGDLPEQIPPSHVWVDGLGQVRILDFPVRSRKGVPPPADWHPAGWQRYLARVSLFCLDGPAVAPGGERAFEMPRAALPEHARVLLERIASAGPDPAGLLRFLEGLQESSERPAALTRSRRAATLVLSTLPASISVLMLVLVFPIMFRAAPEVVHLGSVSQYLERREELEASAGSSEARRMREAIDTVLAASYQRYRDTPFAQQILAQKPETTRSELERLLRERPSTSKEEFDRARGLVESSFLRRIVRADSLAATFLVLSLLVGLVAVPMSFILRGGVLFRLLGVTVQRADGRPASRLRCLARGFAVWSPALGILVIRLLPRIPAARAGVLFFCLALFLAAAAYALARPTRGVQDFLTGTRLVPR